MKLLHLAYLPFLVAALALGCEVDPDETYSGDGDGTEAGGGASGDGDGDGDGDAETETPETCSTDLDCKPLGLLCNKASGVCAACITDDDCGAGSDCRGGVCLVVETCTNTLDCSGDLVCDTTAGQCFACVGNEDCTDETQPLCVDHECTASCTEAEVCVGKQVCNETSGICQECVKDGDCADTQFCSEGRCEEYFCTAGAVACVDGALATCLADGSAYAPNPVACPSGCDDSSSPPACITE